MNLKYEQQWELVEKIIKERQFGREINFYNPITWVTKASIINEVFQAYYFMDYDVLAYFEANCKEQKLYDWENQQKPLLDKLIEVTLWNKKFHYSNSDDFIIND